MVFTESLMSVLSGTGARIRVVSNAGVGGLNPVCFVDCRYAVNLSAQTVATVMDNTAHPVLLFGRDWSHSMRLADVSRVRIVGTYAVCNFSAEESRLKVGILGAGTADRGLCLHVADVLQSFGVNSACVLDCGVCGIHRSVAASAVIEHDCTVVIVVAGMEGALARLVCELVNVPVLILPSSAGYGVSRGGIAAFASGVSSSYVGGLLCAPDDVIGACSMALRIIRVAERGPLR